MLRNKLSQIISSSYNASKAVVNRSFAAKSSKIPKRNRKTSLDQTRPVHDEAKKHEKGNLKKEKLIKKDDKNYPCAETTKIPCKEKPKLNPCAEIKNQKPCEEAKKNPCEETKKSEPCAESNPCEELNKKSLKISSPKMPPCKESPAGSGSSSHHSLIPPGYILSQLKNFELKSESSTFHLKTSQ